MLREAASITTNSPRFCGALLRPEALAEAWQAVVTATPVLRTAFSWRAAARRSRSFCGGPVPPCTGRIGVRCRSPRRPSVAKNFWSRTLAAGLTPPALR